jgi:hypothetical protein
MEEQFLGVFIEILSALTLEMLVDNLKAVLKWGDLSQKSIKLQIKQLVDAAVSSRLLTQSGGENVEYSLVMNEAITMPLLRVSRHAMLVTMRCSSHHAMLVSPCDARLTSQADLPDSDAPLPTINNFLKSFSWRNFYLLCSKKLQDGVVVPHLQFGTCSECRTMTHECLAFRAIAPTEKSILLPLCSQFRWILVRTSSRQTDHEKALDDYLRTSGRNLEFLKILLHGHMPGEMPDSTRTAILASLREDLSTLQRFTHSPHSSKASSPTRALAPSEPGRDHSSAVASASGVPAPGVPAPLKGAWAPGTSKAGDAAAPSLAAIVAAPAARVVAMPAMKTPEDLRQENEWYSAESEKVSRYPCCIIIITAICWQL